MTKTPPKTVAQIFEMPRTWCQGSYRKADGKICLARAIADHVRARVRAKIGIGDGKLIMDWNDAPGRTQAEVHALAVELGI